jgi:hypothetical protein
MTVTLNDVTSRKRKAEPSPEEQAASELVRRAKEQGLSLTGPDGLLKQLTKTVLETALNEEMTEHLGYAKHDPAGAGSDNIRNGTRAKTVLTEHSGQVEVAVPRDRAGTFEPQIVKKRQRRLSGVDEVVLSLYAKRLTTGEMSAHFAEIYRAAPQVGDRLPALGEHHRQIHRDPSPGHDRRAAPVTGRARRRTRRGLRGPDPWRSGKP